MNTDNKDPKKEFMPILYSFRRCPYAMRARLAILSAQTPVVVREISLKTKPKELIAISSKSTVPCLQTSKKTFTESMDIILWVLKNNDPENLLIMPKEGNDIIAHNDGPFKITLDRTKYSSKLKNIDIYKERKVASEFLIYLNGLLTKQFLFGDKKTLADIAILPFIRQYAFIDRSWFIEQKWDNLSNWLDNFLKSASFNIIQTKYPIWVQDQKPIIFPPLFHLR